MPLSGQPNNDGVSMRYAVYRAPGPWPPKEASVAVTGLRWRATYRQYDHDWGGSDLVPAYIEYVVQIQLKGAAAADTRETSREIRLVTA